jgi:hypothetical protein
VNLTGWSKSLDVTADGAGIVSHAGLALLRQLADKTGLTGGCPGRWPHRGCWPTTAAGSPLTWPARSLTAAR